MFNSVCSSNDNQNNFVRSTNHIWFLLNWICLNESYRIDITFWTSKSAQDLFSSSNCFFAMYRHCDWIGAPYWDDRISFLTVGCRMPVWDLKTIKSYSPRLTYHCEPTLAYHCESRPCVSTYEMNVHRLNMRIYMNIVRIRSNIIYDVTCTYVYISI